MKNTRLLAAMGIAALTVLLATGCSTTVGYRDAGEATTMSRNFSRADLQQSVMAMVDSMLANPVLQRKLGQQFPNRYPTISIPPGALKNETYQMGLNLASLTDSIRTKLINSGVFEFVDVQSDAMLHCPERRVPWTFSSCRSTAEHWRRRPCPSVRWRKKLPARFRCGHRYQP